MTIKIALTQGYTALVSDEDADLAEMSWHAHGHPHKIAKHTINHPGGKTSMLVLHRVVAARMLGRELDRYEWVTVKNGDRCDCRRENLLIGEPAQVISRRVRQERERKSGKLRGAFLHHRGNRWEARGRGIGHIGMFATQKEAHEAFKKAHAKHYGELSIYWDEYGGDA